MPLLGGLLAGLFAAIAEFFAKYVSKKVAFAAAAIAVFAGLTTGLALALSALVSAAYVALPDIPGLQLGIWLAMPDNGPTLLAAVVSLDTAVALYRWNVHNLHLASTVS